MPVSYNEADAALLSAAHWRPCSSLMPLLYSGRSSVQCTKWMGCGSTDTMSWDRWASFATLQAVKAAPNSMRSGAWRGSCNAQ